MSMSSPLIEVPLSSNSRVSTTSSGSRSGTSASRAGTSGEGASRSAARSCRTSSRSSAPVNRSPACRRLVAAQHRRSRPARSVDHDLGALAGREQQVVEAHRRRQQPAVAGDHVELPVVGEVEVVDPRVGGVEQAQADPLGGHVEVRAGGAVDEHRVAEDAVALEQPRGGVQLDAVELLVLHDDRDVVDAVLPRQRQRPRSSRSSRMNIPATPAVDLLGGLAVRVRVVPERGRGLVDPPGRRPGVLVGDHLVRAAVHLRRQVHAVPVQRALLAQLVGDVDQHLLAALRPQGRPEVGRR